MTISLKTPEEIERMRTAGQAAMQVLEMIVPHVKAGVTTEELNTLCHDHIVNDLDATPAPLDYQGFPKSICTSVNHVICHGIPGEKKLKKGDIINIDVTVIKEGFHGDCSKMFGIGKVGVLEQRLMRISHECMVKGIKLVKPGISLGDIGHAIQSHAENAGFSVVREYCGHGIGREFHESPQVLHYGSPGSGPILQEGMTFTIEPMINAGKKDTRVLADGWTVVTWDHKPSAEWEHTILVTEVGYEALTCLPGHEL